ncbi:MAG: PD-(D/E)XK nuclease family protein [Deltaproteobacteria bacterium]|nr:PD-(D/E)XK nuclease family protein [Deltaproteobacteria bacterium]
MALQILIVDLILRNGADFVVVDHKTGKKFNDEDEGQLVLYAEYVRRKYRARRCLGVFDQYRIVPNLATVRNPVHQRTSVNVAAARTKALVPRFRRAWSAIQSIRDERDALRGDECWFCF